MTLSLPPLFLAQHDTQPPPDNLSTILKTLPRQCFEKNRRQAWISVLVSVFSVALGYAAITFLPSFLLPFSWIWTGTALTGLFVLAHDCGHRSFAKRRWVNDWVGHLLMLPLIYPFHPWRILHNRHHRFTNQLKQDNAWEPWTEDAFLASVPAIRALYRGLRGYFWWTGSIIHWLTLHFDLRQFSQPERPKARLSIVVCLGFALVFFPLLFYWTGWWGVIKFWLLPWLVYHFWMSTFTLVHHTDAGIPFQPAERWNAATAQLTGTVHCDYPGWVEFLCHDINVHIPHHISVAIPSYHLRLAQQSLEENWGSHLQKRRFSWALMRDIVQQCHLYHPQKAYQSFTDLEPL
ncbi:fatty acid desaturase [Synechococcus sp. Nb3U1]|uniref:fatty acid desaturase n=1 Tax=Synechococcus sp. Nb3U1 TaxID=1914529 RepID=UPI001F4118A9|nr:fatty acid desaturase [Synechococcus sp. Nb3U1]MCF2971916.1 fatty acid desaturase [Synechococcus sp. Nb3U1]